MIEPDRPDPVLRLFLELHTLRRTRYHLSKSNIADLTVTPPEGWPPRPPWLRSRTQVIGVLSRTERIARGQPKPVDLEKLPKSPLVLTVVWVLDHEQCGRFEELYEKAEMFLSVDGRPVQAGPDSTSPAVDPLPEPPEPVEDTPEVAAGEEDFGSVVPPAVLLDRLRDEIEASEGRAVQSGFLARRLVIRLAPDDFESYAEREHLVIQMLVYELGKLPVYAGDPPWVGIEPFPELRRGEFEFAFEFASVAPPPDWVKPPPGPSTPPTLPREQSPLPQPTTLGPAASPWAQPPVRKPDTTTFGAPAHSGEQQPARKPEPKTSIPGPDRDVEPFSEPEEAPGPSERSAWPVSPRFPSWQPDGEGGRTGSDEDPRPGDAEPVSELEPAPDDAPPVFDRALFARRPEQRPGP